MTRKERQDKPSQFVDTATQDVTVPLNPNGSVDNETTGASSSDDPLILADTAYRSINQDTVNAHLGAVDTPSGDASHYFDYMNLKQALISPQILILVFQVLTRRLVPWNSSLKSLQ